LAQNFRGLQCRQESDDRDGGVEGRISDTGQVSEDAAVWKTVTDPTFAALTAIRHCAGKASPERLVRFALDRHGFSDSDSGFGITYPGDLDEYARIVENRTITDGFVLAHGFWGPPDGYEVLVPEWLYRDVLAEVLECMGMWREAASVRVPEGWLGPAKPNAAPHTGRM
jgi:hypothetical protein